MRREAPSKQLPVPSEQALLSIPAVVGIRRVIPTLLCGCSGGGDRPERLEQAGLGLMFAVINAAKIREGNHAF